jgi:iron complex outermembrane receptor protein
MASAFQHLSLAASLSAIAGLAVAQQPTTLEEVIVTATKRPTSLQDTPVTVNAFSDAAIREAGINNAGDLAIMTPSLSVTANTSPFSARLQIRGVGTAQTDPALEPSVGLFVDGVYMGRSGLGMSDLTDIERIEVLQGPQGTLYGKNTNAGAISIVTKNPNQDFFEGYVEATAGNYNLQKVTAAVSGPITDTVAYRFSATNHQRDGYLENSSGTDLNAADDWNIIGKIIFQPTDDFSILLSGSHVERDTNCCGADAVQSDSVNAELAAQGFDTDKNDPFDYKTAVDVDSEFIMEADALAVTIDYQQDWGEITSITAWNDYNYRFNSDIDRSELDILPWIDERNSGDSISQELRFSSQNEEGNFEYQVGVFYYQQTTRRGDNAPDNGLNGVLIGDDFITIASQQPLPTPLPVDQIAQPGDNIYANHVWENETLALFSQSTWHVGERWHLTGGLRWTEEKKEADLYSTVNSTAFSDVVLGQGSILNTVMQPIDADLNRSSQNVDWLLSASFDLYENTMLFTSASTGSKSGGFNGSNGDIDEREFDDESTMSYELGIKSTLWDSKLRLNATAFYTEITDYQAQQQQQSGIGTTVSNDGEVITSGLDVNVDLIPLPFLTLNAGLLYMDRYDITEGPNKGNQLPYTAGLSGNLAATFVFPVADGGVYLRGDYSFMGDHLTNGSSETRRTDEQTRQLYNAKLGFRNEDWDFSIWGKNLSADEYAITTTSSLAYTGMDAYFLAPPRTYGGTVRYSF